MKIAITVDTAADLTEDILKKYDIRSIAFGINFSDKSVEDRNGIGSEIFEYVEKTKTLTKTSAIPPIQYQEFFESLLKDYDAVIHFSVSSRLSSTINNANLVAKEMENVYVVDSMNLSTGIGLLAINARELADQGKTPEEIYNISLGQVDKVRVHFILDKLHYMHKGGRCGVLTLLGANILKIKPELYMKDGRMAIGNKYRGQLDKVVKNFGEDMTAKFASANKKYAFVTHSSSLPELEEYLENVLKEAGFETIYNTSANGTICSHCGPNTIGVVFMEN